MIQSRDTDELALGPAGTTIRSEPAGREETVFGAGEAEVFAQGAALIFAAEKAAALQFRHHAVDKVVEPARARMGT